MLGTFCYSGFHSVLRVCWFVLIGFFFLFVLFCYEVVLCSAVKREKNC